MNKIIIKGLRVFAFHGANDFEQEKGQMFELDIILDFDLTLAGQTDNLVHTINYSDVSKLAIKTMKSQNDKLIERAATRVAQAILENFPTDKVTVTLKKPHAPVPADFEYVAVEITLKKGNIRSI